jgi:hypothetical protein
MPGEGARFLREIQRREGRDPNIAEQNQAVAAERAGMGKPPQIPGNTSKFAETLQTEGSGSVSAEGARMQRSNQRSKDAGVTADDTVVDGQTMPQFMEAARAGAAGTREGRKILLDAKIAKLEVQEARRIELDAKIAELEAQEEAAKVDPRIDTSPLPTGIERIDKEGTSQFFTGGSGNLLGTINHPDLDDPEMFDHPDTIRRNKAQQGIDMMSGLDFKIRKQIAAIPNVPSMRKDAVKNILMTAHEEMPDDIGPTIRFDQTLSEFQMLMPSSTEGKYRWTSMDGTGVEIGDFGDMFNPAEIGAAIGGMVGTTFGPGKLRYLNIKKAQPGKGGFGGAVLGRTIGETFNLVRHFKETGQAPTHEELLSLTGGGLMMEFMASALTEAGAKILRVGSNAVQELAATAAGKEAVHIAPEDVPLVNAQLEESRQLLDDLNVTGIPGVTGQKFSLTRGQATRQIDLLAEETASQTAASAEVKSQFATAKAQNDKALQAYIVREFDSGLDLFDRTDGIIIAANDSLGNIGDFAIAQTANGTVHILPKLAQEGGEHVGLRIDPGKDVWKVKANIVEESLQGLGLRRDGLIVAGQEAQARGAVLSAGDELLAADAQVWRELDKTGALGPLTWADDIVDTGGILTTESGGPVVRMVEPDPVTPELLEAFNKPGRGASGRMEANKDFRTFMTKPGVLLNVVSKEMEGSPYVRQEMKEAILADYQKQVRKKGKFSEANYQEWQDSTRQVVDAVFSPKELVKIRSSPHALKEVTDAGHEAMKVRRQALSKSLGIKPDDKLLKEVGQSKLLNQIKSRSSQQIRRTMKILDAQGTGDDVRRVYMQELGAELLAKGGGKNWIGFEAWIHTRHENIEDIMGNTNYNAHLRTVASVLKRKSDQGMTRGARTETNSTGLALFRVAFGPLSRAQRFISGAKRGQIRATAASASDLITDPAKLKELVRLIPMQVESRQAARIIHSTGLAEKMNFPGYDPESEEDRQKFANQILIELAQERFEGEDVE